MTNQLQPHLHSQSVEGQGQAQKSSRRQIWRMMLIVLCSLFVLVVLAQNSFGLQLFGKEERGQDVAAVSVDGTTVEPTTWDGCSILSGIAGENRVIAIGDIHGSYDGLLTDLFAANITTAPTACEWKSQVVSTLLVQMGDMVDRGPGALESMECLRHLQATAADFNSKVVRLLGNHELWWLTGIFYQRNKADTDEKVIKFLRLLWDDVLARRIVGSHLHYMNSKPIMFVHAGYSDDFVKYLKLGTAEEISNYTNNHLVYSVSQCNRLPCPAITKDELYEAGPSRGGKGIGGPYWTDFTTLLDEDNTDRLTRRVFQKPFVQVVGHTMAFCYDPRSPGKHPADSVAECALGLVRPSARLQSVCVDGGMYAGARAFLEITPHGRYISYERRGDPATTPWKARDLTREACGV